MSPAVYLTIDDAPSASTLDKINQLKGMPAIFFLRGQHIEEYPEHALEIINAGFSVGNHSYSHPFFSKLTFDECREEILKTETLINSLYTQTKHIRQHKYIRLPFGDEGGKHREKLIHFMNTEGFIRPLSHPKSATPHLHWDWDLQDYKSHWKNNPEKYREALESSWDHHSNDNPIILMHDFNDSHHLFEITLNFLKDKKCNFLEI